MLQMASCVIRKAIYIRVRSEDADNTHGQDLTVMSTELTRKEKFDAAVGLANMTYADFRRDVFPVSHVHLYCVLTGERKGNPMLNKAIDEFIATQFARIASNESRETQDDTREVA